MAGFDKWSGRQGVKILHSGRCQTPFQSKLILRENKFNYPILKIGHNSYVHVMFYLGAEGYRPCFMMRILSMSDYQMKNEMLYQTATPDNTRIFVEASDDHTLSALALRQFLLDMVALVYEVELNDLLAPTRGRQKVAFARQVAMYLAHTAGGLSLTKVGVLFERDRTTVAHACALVEDERDDPVFDRTLSYFESAITCQMQLSRLRSTGDRS